MKPPFVTRNTIIPLTIRKKIGKLAPVVPGTRFTITIFGQQYVGITGIHMDDKIWLYGMHEAATVRLMRDILTRQRSEGKIPVYMDIGTNAGMHLVAVAALADRAYGFEPWAAVREKAAQNLALNPLLHVTLFDFGLSDVDASLPFLPPDANNLGVGMFVAKPGKETIALSVRRGDDVVAAHDIRPTLIKIDVEGHEKKALSGLAATIARYKPDVIFEYSDGSRADMGDAGVRAALFGPDYKFFGIRRSREMPSLEPFNPAKKYENVLATVNG